MEAHPTSASSPCVRAELTYPSCLDQTEKALQRDHKTQRTRPRAIRRDQIARLFVCLACLLTPGVSRGQGRATEIRSLVQVYSSRALAAK